MLNNTSLTETIIRYISKIDDFLDYPKSFDQLIYWDRRQYYRNRERLHDKDRRQRKRVREALRRLEKAQIISLNETTHSYQLSPKGWMKYLYYYSAQEEGNERDLVESSPRKYIIIFDIPEKHRRFRNLFRECLHNQQCKIIQKSVFLCPNKNVFKWSQKVVANCELEKHVKFVEATKIH